MTEGAVYGHDEASTGAPALTSVPKPPDTRFRPIQAVALIMGSIIGVGIFNLPSSLASYGPITLVSMGLTTIGALAFADAFCGVVPAPAGGRRPVRLRSGRVRERHWLPERLVVLDHRVGRERRHRRGLGPVRRALYKQRPEHVWLHRAGAGGAVAAHARQPERSKEHGLGAGGTTVLKFAALLFMSTVGLFYISSANYHPWNVSGQTAIAAIGGGMAIALFSYLGVETASVAAAKVRDPDRNIPRATIMGTLATAVVYILSFVAIFGILPSSTLAASSQPFSEAANAMFGGSWPGDVMAVAVIISGLGALNGWTMICAEMPLAAANDGLFPARFKQLSSKGVPAYGIIASTVLASIAMAVNYIGASGETAFTTLVLMSGITAAIPYGFSALAQAKWRWVDHKTVQTPRFVRDMTIAIVSLVFAVLFIFYSRNSGHSFWVYWAPFFLAGGALLLGIPVYMAQRGHMSTPEPVPAYR